MSDDTPPLSARTPRRKKLPLTKADWDRIEQQNRRSEAQPDPAQANLLESDSGATA